MTNEIQQQADGHHIVRVDDKVYVDTPQNFKKDFGTTLPDLPEGADERIYRQGIHHSILAKNSVINGGPIPWSAMDSLFNKIDVALAKQKKRDDDDKDDRKKKVDDDIKTMLKEAKDKQNEIEAEDKKRADRQASEIEIRNAQLRTETERNIAEGRDKVKADADKQQEEHDRAEFNNPHKKPKEPKE